MLREKRYPLPETKHEKTLIMIKVLSLSIVKLIEIIGEAASKVTDETKNECSEIPWANIIAMRNRLIHAYFDIDLDRVWDTIIDDMPSLINTLEKLISSEELPEKMKDQS
jgi:uncharacterized protein with HEPN domain